MRQLSLVKRKDKLYEIDTKFGKCHEYEIAVR